MNERISGFKYSEFVKSMERNVVMHLMIYLQSLKHYELSDNLIARILDLLANK